MYEIYSPRLGLLAYKKITLDRKITQKDNALFSKLFSYNNFPLFRSTNENYEMNQCSGTDIIEK